MPGYNLNSCLLLKSLSLRTAENLRIKSLPPSETWTLARSYRKWIPKLTLIDVSFVDFIHIYILAFFLLYYQHFLNDPIKPNMFK